MFGLAARHDAIAFNPVRDAAPLRVPVKEKHALTLDEVRDLRVRLAADVQAVNWDLPDLVDIMLATGLRIGEACAITWPAVDVERGTVEVRGTVIRVADEGLRIKLKPKSRAGWRIVELPSWAVDIFKRRHVESPVNEWGAVFTSPKGMLRDPSNTQADLKATFQR